MKRPSCPNCGKTMASNGTTPGGKRRWRCGTQTGHFCYTTTEETPVSARKQSGRRTGKAPIFTRTLGKTVTRFLVTAAQNATPVHKPFWQSLQRAANEMSAEVLVIPLRYKNPTSRWTRSQQNEEVWDPALTPYLYNARKALNKNIVVLGDVKTVPTASSPLTGFDAITHGESAILGHTKLQLKTVATPQHSMPKLLTTTGAVTVPNYTDSKLGKLGEFHHTVGAALVEVSGKLFHLRQINADKRDGTFQDLHVLYAPESATYGVPTLGLVMGDTHVDFIDPGVEAATFGDSGIVETLRPGALVWHDLLDAYAVNPHHAGNPFNAIAKWRAGAQAIWVELLRARDFVRRHTPEYAKSIVVSSNHDDMLRRWIIGTDWRVDPANSQFYLETALEMVRGTKLGESGTEYPAPLALWLKKLAPEVTVLGTDESMVIGGVEVGMHGDRGPNGSRGSRMNLRRIGVKSIIGHCLTAEHDVLTRRGWSPISATEPGDDLLSFDAGTGRSVWSRAVQKQQFAYSGRLIRIRHQGAFDQEVTPNHRLLLRDGSALSVCEAVLTRSPADLPLTALPVRDGVAQDELLLRRIVAVCADGSFYSGTLTFNIKKERKHKRLDTLFGSALLPRQKPNATNGAVKVSLRRDSAEYKSVMGHVVPTTSGKILPDWFLELDPAGREIVLDECTYWDGTFKSTSTSGRQFSTYKEREAIIIASLATLQGRRCTMSKRPDSRGWIVSWCDDSDHRPVTGKTHDAALSNAWGCSTREVVDEPVYCFTVVDTGCFWVRSRRTGLISLTHNSHAPGIEEGCYQTGTSTRLRMEYNTGPSSWLNTHCVIYPNGKRTLINIIKGEWRA